jgi:hypothetical protein
MQQVGTSAEERATRRASCSPTCGSVRLVQGPHSIVAVYLLTSEPQPCDPPTEHTGGGDRPVPAMKTTAFRCPNHGPFRGSVFASSSLPARGVVRSGMAERSRPDSVPAVSSWPIACDRVSSYHSRAERSKARRASTPRTRRPLATRPGRGEARGPGRRRSHA